MLLVFWIHFWIWVLKRNCCQTCSYLCLQKHRSLQAWFLQFSWLRCLSDTPLLAALQQVVSLVQLAQSVENKSFDSLLILLYAIVGYLWKYNILLLVITSAIVIQKNIAILRPSPSLICDADVLYFFVLHECACDNKFIFKQTWHPVKVKDAWLYLLRSARIIKFSFASIKDSTMLTRIEHF